MASASSRDCCMRSQKVTRKNVSRRPVSSASDRTEKGRPRGITGQCQIARASSRRAVMVWCHRSGAPRMARGMLRKVAAVPRSAATCSDRSAALARQETGAAATRRQAPGSDAPTSALPARGLGGGCSCTQAAPARGARTARRVREVLFKVVQLRLQRLYDVVFCAGPREVGHELRRRATEQCLPLGAIRQQNKAPPIGWVSAQHEDSGDTRHVKAFLKLLLAGCRVDG